MASSETEQEGKQNYLKIPLFFQLNGAVLLNINVFEIY